MRLYVSLMGMSTVHYLRSVGATVGPEIQDYDSIWTLQDIAAQLRITDKAAKAVTKDPDFPHPVVNTQRNCRWLAADVKAFICARSKVRRTAYTSPSAPAKRSEISISHRVKRGSK
jgi:hypothetical protein